ncbi:MAG: protein kinase [Pirellulales bacterium]|nr:protein kinase [Pirellulales bacterium]
MSDHTQVQGSDERRRAQELSLRRGRPPCELPGYEPRRFLGAGAYGEVWVAIDRTTGRQVAIKFYLHRGGLDWSLLAHEVEKLAFLSADRYVVQLLDVGWESEPPYYVMEYVEHGSLEERLRLNGPLKVAEAVAIFRELATGLNHAHGKGVLHCDLKPANILLDQDGKPRLADFGQSRLSHDQAPALGTLFYMAPEQADLSAIPDARWDVYALGAILHAMLTGNPPHRHDKAVTEIERAPHLEERLLRYRRVIQQAPPAIGNLPIAGVDKRLADILGRCMAADPAERFLNVQAVLNALDARQQHRARRPLIVLGALGPLLLLTVVAVVAWLWFNTSVQESKEALVGRALEGLGFAASSVATGAGKELEMRFRDVEEIAADSKLREMLAAIENDPPTNQMLVELSDPRISDRQRSELLKKFGSSQSILDLQAYFTENAMDRAKSDYGSSWFLTDARGLQLARWPESKKTTGRNFSWRSYFHGGNVDRKEGQWRAGPDEHIRETRLSAVYRSKSTGRWVVAVSAPIHQRKTGDQPRQFLGIIGRSNEIGKDIINLPDEASQFAVLVDGREGDRTGLILQHPLFDTAKRHEKDRLPDRFEKYRVSADALPNPKTGSANYRDPLGHDEEGAQYQQRFLSAQAPIEVRDQATGWHVIVQEGYDEAVGGTLDDLRNRLVTSGQIALAAMAIVVLGLWWLAVRIAEKPGRWKSTQMPISPSMAETLPSRPQDT